MESKHLKPEDILAGDAPSDNPLLDLLSRFDRQQLAELSGLSLNKVNDLFETPSDADVRKLDIEIPGGITLRNINNDEDMNRAVHILKTLNLSDGAMASLMAGPNPTASPPVRSTTAPKAEEGGTTIQEMVPRYNTRKRNKLAAKTLYEYANYHRKFVEWLECRKSKKHIPVHSITRADIADFIDDLLDEGIAPKTITQKYLAAISGLFELAQSMGILPEGQQLVTRGHKVFTKSDARKSATTNSYKPFTDNETYDLVTIDGARRARFTLSRDTATSSDSVELMGLDHPLIQEELGRWRSVPPEDVGIAVSGDVDAPVLLSLWMVEASAGNGERRVVVQPIAVKQDGTRVPAVERQAEQYLQAPVTSPKFAPEQRQELFAQVVEPTLQRELKHKGAANGDGSYSAELIGYIEISSN